MEFKLTKLTRIITFSYFVLMFFFGQHNELMAENTVTILGSTVLSRPEIYIANSSVNIRKAPSIKSKKVGHFKAGTRIQSLGVTKDGFWIVAELNEKPVGFVYLKVLQIIIDGSLKKDLVGRIDLPNKRRCGFRIHFVGKSEVEGQSFFMADYDVRFSCVKNKKAIVFPAQMFLAEVPNYLKKTTPIFQINLDVLDNYHAEDDVFSSIMYYRPKNKEVEFGGTNFLDYSEPSDRKKIMPAKSIEDALKNALELAIRAWSSKAWSDIARNSKN